jgi:hypothetical protein
MRLPCVYRRAFASLTLPDYFLIVWYVGFCFFALRGTISFLNLDLPTRPHVAVAVVSIVSWAAWLASLFARRLSSPVSKASGRRSPFDDLWDRQLDG